MNVVSMHKNTENETRTQEVKGVARKIIHVHFVCFLRFIDSCQQKSCFLILMYRELKHRLDLRIADKFCVFEISLTQLSVLTSVEKC